MTMSDKIRRLLAKGLNVADIAKKLNVKPGRVYTVKYLDKKKKKPSRIVEAVKEMKQALDVVEPKRVMINLARRKDGAIIDLNKGGEVISPPDPVNHPPHYTKGGIETIDFIEAKDLNYRLGNVIKYVSRAGKKDSDPIQDLEKAAWYLQREINARKNA